LAASAEATSDACWNAACWGRACAWWAVNDRWDPEKHIIADPASCVFDASLTQADGAVAKVFGWYDNEWGYTNRLVDLTQMLAHQG
jgi:glyceraldehyde 3-phosphate dehydrogenase